MRAVLIAVAWADIIVCAVAQTLKLIMPALAVKMIAIVIRKRGRR